MLEARDSLRATILDFLCDHIGQRGALLLLPPERSPTEELRRETVGTFCFPTVISALFGTMGFGDGGSSSSYSLELEVGIYHGIVIWMGWVRQPGRIGRPWLVGQLVVGIIVVGGLIEAIGARIWLGATKDHVEPVLLVLEPASYREG